MSTLVITRASGSIVDSFRPYEVLVDGFSRGRVSVNQQLSIDIEPGIHAVRFRIGFYSSLPVMVHVSEGETSVSCRSTTRRLFGLLSVFAPHTWIMTSVKEYSDLPQPLLQASATVPETPAETDVLDPYLSKAFLHRYHLAR